MIEHEYVIQYSNFAVSSDGTISLPAPKRVVGIDRDGSPYVSFYDVESRWLVAVRPPTLADARALAAHGATDWEDLTA